ncbi:MAG: SusC/RagA family TonB-linked outer membrane protein [Bacteroidales bacterium]|nr:SusC/RagA family TonB-linked outer membrane protein [Bacteroidales bacterium]
MKDKILKNLLIFCTALGLFSYSGAFAQQPEISTTTVSATVLDDSGEPVPDVFVMSFVTHDKVITDSEGKFTLKVSAASKDQIVIDEPGYEVSTTELFGGDLMQESITLVKMNLIDGKNGVKLPYREFNNNRSVSSTFAVSGEELASYPTTSFLDALSGRIPGLVIEVGNTKPGHESVSASIRGESASIYIDGITRDPSDLSVYEVESVQVIKDLSGRASLGVSGVNPVIWITTRSGKDFNREINVTAGYGISAPTSLPGYLDSYDYATLFNEALRNDGLDPLYTQAELDAYRDGSDRLYYPSIDYYADYVKSSTPFRKANINFSGGDNRVNYFSMLDYIGSDGLEAVGEQTKTDRFKLRGSANIRINDFISMSVNLSGTYGHSRFPNQGSGAGAFNMFDILSTYPSNAHAMTFNDSLLLISDDYGVNLDNELLYSGYAIGIDLNTQNTANVLIDLNSLMKGLTFRGTASFDIYSNITTNKGGTAALYRLLPENEVQRIQEEVIDPTLSQGYDDFLRRTVGFLQLNYDRSFGDHALSMHTTYFQGLVERRTTSANYQPDKMQDLSYRANYAYDDRYVVQFDLAYTGSMKLPEGRRFSLYPTIGAAWVLSNESFLGNSSAVDYLKLFGSLGIMGNEDFTLEGYNSYYLYRTLWYDAGDWQSGIQGNKGDVINIYNIQQAGSEDYTLPKRSYLNIGIQGELFNRALSAEVNYFYQKDYDQISQKSSYTPSLYGTGGFLPATNFGESGRWGVDGMIQHSGRLGDFRYNVGANILYTRGKYLVVDEPVAEAEYRKLAGKDRDLIWMYEADGLFQSQNEINTHEIIQSWGELKPGDIRYVDYNDDDVVDEKDIHTTGAHYPRMFYGLNLSLGYRGITLYVLGQGVANGEIMLSNPRYFWINGTTQNYSEPMLDRWPETNNYPRLTTQSWNNYQGSSFWLSNAGYLRLKNVELSYTLPKPVSQQMLLRDWKIFVRASNLLVLSELTKYSLNPENVYLGIYDYPMYRTITFGVTCKF